MLDERIGHSATLPDLAALMPLVRAAIDPTEGNWGKDRAVRWSEGLAFRRCIAASSMEAPEDFQNVAGTVEDVDDFEDVLRLMHAIENEMSRKPLHKKASNVG